MDELAAMNARPDVFRRERLGEWGKTGDATLALDEAQWSAGASARSTWPARADRFVFSDGPARFLAVDCTYNAEMTSLVEVGLLAGEKVGIVVLESAPGLEWVAGAVAAIRAVSPRVQLSFDPIRTGDLTGDLQAVGVTASARRKRVLPVSSRDLTLACDGLVRAVREGRVVHDDPRLDAAAGAATRSTFDDGKGWKLVGTNGADVSPLIAAALALRAIGAHPGKSTSKGAVSY